MEKVCDCGLRRESRQVSSTVLSGVVSERGDQLAPCGDRLTVDRLNGRPWPDSREGCRRRLTVHLRDDIADLERVFRDHRIIRVDRADGLRSECTVMNRSVRLAHAEEHSAVGVLTYQPRDHRSRRIRHAVQA